MSKHRTWTILRSDMALISQFGIGNLEFESQSTPLEHHALSSVGSAAEIASTMIRAPSSCLQPAKSKSRRSKSVHFPFTPHVGVSPSCTFPLQAPACRGSVPRKETSHPH
jgi:hypothetical protein